MTAAGTLAATKRSRASRTAARNARGFSQGETVDGWKLSASAFSDRREPTPESQAALP